ncbi:UDP-N-acetylglucosamine 2-epimerase (non-hydrolyzing) [Mobiluncus curtisii]|uniref:non-hydrolyzing UDP-N-acetylglucosamine 2-epimerase n=1 Tax=Mobiluncus curtisii TaxID=2051 RepID=UPI0014706285|nr:UDP-N-acetylglucosamine 2-epimerase (non-hydrolyzing) [Mobiluncus curtisii]MCV0021030.1 UDP-N-acetylglucosamine 2-epimerase (non-hydrolyzing) [Mobiluncus curtisii]NMW47512.1 UDP-N-acetylglucosamine 2-epimerase (non-hydrolyzing) [Mobiluncus curtisii]
MKIMSIVGARPQFVKLAPIARACAQTAVEHLIVHTGQHYDPMLSEVFFQDLEIPRPDVHLNVGSASHGVQTGRMLAELEPVIAEAQPDWVLVYGDTNSTLAGTLAAVKIHQRVAHLEAGLRSFNRDMPEEINRVLTDHAADLLLTPTQVAMQHLAEEGLENRSVLVGDVMTDVLFTIRDRVQSGQIANPIPAELGLAPSQYALATIHRAENTDDSSRLEAVVAALADLPFPVVLLAHPRLRAKAEAAGVNLTRGAIHLHEPLAYPQLVAAALQARHIVTDSGGLQKEAFLLRVPATTVRPQTEWVETVELGWNELAEPSSLVQSATRPLPEPTTATPYGTGAAAQEVVKVLREHAAQS